MKKLTLMLIIALGFDSLLSYGAIGDQWDAGTDFSSASNPNGPWKYIAWPSLVTMVSSVGGPHGYPLGWVNPNATYQSISPNTGANPDTDPTGSTVAGHGHAGLRWTSPVDGWVQLSGYLFMRSDDDPTRVHWFILKQNGVEFSRASVKLNPNGTAILGAAGKVTLQEGSGGPNILLRQVSVGDIIDMGIENIGGPGHFYIAMFHITQVEAPPPPNSWDAGLDFSVAGNPNGQWSYLTQPGRALMSYTGNLNGLGAGWYDTSNGTFSIQKPSWVGPNEVGGHSNVCLRWTSPVDDRVQISGHLWMAEISNPCSVQWFHLEHNGVPFLAGIVKQDSNIICPGYGSTYYGGVLGRAGTVDFTQGDTGLDALIREVNVGDTIDLVIKENHYYGAAFAIERLGPACGDSAHPYPAGDLNKNCKVDMSDFAELAAGYSADANPSATVSGTILDAPVTAPDGSISFNMSDDSVVLPDVPYSVLFFEDNFDTGKKSQWQDLVGEWGPVWGKTHVEGGKLIADAGESTVIVTGEENKWTDQVVHVDANFDRDNEICFEVLLRHNSGHTFILVFLIGQQFGAQEVVARGPAGWHTPFAMRENTVVDTSRTITMIASAIGNRLTAWVTDGLPGHTYSIEGTIPSILGPGYVGVMHTKEWVLCNAAFDNFTAKTPVFDARQPVKVVIPNGVTGIPALQVDDLVKVTGAADSCVGCGSAGENLRVITIRQSGDLILY